MKVIDRSNILLIGQKAPAFTASAYGKSISYPEDFEGKWIVLFTLPKDFSPGIIYESNNFTFILSEFEKMRTQLIGLCVDSVYKYIHCLDSHKQLAGSNLKHYDAMLPIIEDLDKTVARKFFGYSLEQIIDSVVIIDPYHKIRCQLNYERSTWKNLCEIKYLIQAFQISDQEQWLYKTD